MSVGFAAEPASSVGDRVRRTVGLLRRRGYAVSPARLAEICLGGRVADRDIRWAIAADPDLLIAEDLVVERDAVSRVEGIRSRSIAHGTDSGAYLDMTVSFVRRLVAAAPFIRAVSIAGSLASGGFRASDDVDLNLVVDDGRRHLAYVIVNFLGLLHAMGHRGKPVDDLTRRPLAPRLMTANLILESSQCRPLQRQDEDMAFELLVSEPVYGMETIKEIVEDNPELLGHFPQLAEKTATRLVESPLRPVPAQLYPAFLDWPARYIGQSAWRYMQWTRRNRPEALARVAYVRATMRPYTLFDAN